MNGYEPEKNKNKDTIPNQIALVKSVNIGRNGRPVREEDGSYGKVWTKEGTARLDSWPFSGNCCPNQMIWIKADIKKSNGSLTITKIREIIKDFPWRVQEVGLSNTLIATGAPFWNWSDYTGSTKAEVLVFCEFVGCIRVPLRSEGCAEIQLELTTQPDEVPVNGFEQWKLRAWRWGDGDAENIETPISLATIGSTLNDTWFSLYETRKALSQNDRNYVHRERPHNELRRRNVLPPLSSGLPLHDTWVSSHTIENMFLETNDENDGQGTSDGWARRNNLPHNDSYKRYQMELKHKNWVPPTTQNHQSPTIQGSYVASETPQGLIVTDLPGTVEQLVNPEVSIDEHPTIPLSNAEPITNTESNDAQEREFEGNNAASEIAKNVIVAALIAFVIMCLPWDILLRVFN